MANRILSLAPRKEDTREKQTIIPVLQFELDEILLQFNNAIADVRRQFDFANKLLEDGLEEDAKNIWRSQIVFSEAALDFFIHQISQYGVIKMFAGEWKKTNPYNAMTMTMSHVEAGLNNPESMDWFVEYINSKFSRDVYLGFEAMKDQINLIGLNFGETLEEAFPKPKNGADTNYKPGKTIIVELYNRRNQIAHQLDKRHADAEQEDIFREYVETAISNIEQLVNTIFARAEKRNL